MTINIIEEKLKSYHLNSGDDEENALKEIMQEIAIYGLSSAGFFDKAIFHGGTALRILYGLPRFSEDLDFMLKAPDKNFKWQPFIDAIISTFKEFGVYPEITDKSRVDGMIKKMFLKDDSIGKMINLSFHHHQKKKLAIKFEIDINPPEGSNIELKFLEFPLDHSIISQDLNSSFAGKCHALLCRSYIKGRDWYDFGWYVTRKIAPNLFFLQHALNQQGPWANQGLQVTVDWFIEAMKQKIEKIDWKKATMDTEHFLNLKDKQALQIWGIDFFMDKLHKLKSVMENPLPNA